MFTASIITSFYCLFTGIFALFRNRINKLTLSFFIFCFLTFIWQFSWSINYGTTDKNIANIFSKIGYSAILFLPSTLYLLMSVAIQDSKEKILLYLSYFISFVTFVALISTDYITSGTHINSAGFYPKASDFLFLHIIHTTLVISRAIYIIIKEYILNNNRNVKYTYYLYAMIIFSFCAIDYIGNYTSNFSPIGFLFISISTTILNCGIFSNNILKITLSNIKNLESKVITKSQQPLIENSKISLLILKLLRDKSVEEMVDKIIIPKKNYDEALLFLEIMSSSIEKGQNITNIVLNNLNNQSIDISELDLRDVNSDEIIKHVIQNYDFIYDKKSLISYNPNHNFNIKIDYNLLTFVILNILQNALKYKGKIEINFSENDNYNIINIKNNNSYISPNKKKDIFKDSHYDNSSSISLGLPFCKKTMESFSGNIKVTSSKNNNWTKFSLYFPNFK